MWVRWRSHNDITGFWHMLTSDDEHTMCGYYSAEGVTIECEYDEHPDTDLCGSCVLAAEGLNPVFGCRHNARDNERRRSRVHAYAHTDVVPYLGVKV